MASKVSHFLIFFISILFLLLSLLPNAKSQDPNGDKQYSAFQFLKNIEGAQKGDTLKCIDKLKDYLNRFGYLNESNSNKNYFDDVLESAIKNYQLNFHLRQTGYLDDLTVSTMMTPRCGVPDTNFEKWAPPYKTTMTYAFIPGTFPVCKMIIEKAFKRWENVTKRFITFLESPDYASSDILIGFYNRRHGDDQPFDGKGGILAHAFLLPFGTFHLDEAELWSIAGLQPDAADLYTVALHEIGHLLEFPHSTMENSIMYPLLPFGVAKDLSPHDILGIKAKYNI